MLIKISDDKIGNRTRDFSVCSAVPQPTGPPRAARIAVLSFMNEVSMAEFT
jgi:hypothetical protein